MIILPFSVGKQRKRYIKFRTLSSGEMVIYSMASAVEWTRNLYLTIYYQKVNFVNKFSINVSGMKE